MWRAFKFCLSGLLVLLAGLLAFVYFGRPNSAGMLGFSAVLVFFAAVIWIDYKRPSRALGLAGIVISLGIIFFAFDVLIGGTPYPRECTGRRKLLCEGFNLLYGLGGRPAVAAVWLLAAAAVLYGSYIAFRRARTT